ncbi:MAG: DinB family protein [Gemmatimonadaceae bacterium]
MTTSASPTDVLEKETPFSLLFTDLKPELTTTRRILERVPNGKDDWRPHEKSMALGTLANHVAQLPGLGILILTTEEIDALKRPPQPKPADTAERMKMFDGVSSELLKQLEMLDWDRAMSPWKFSVGEKVFVHAPRAKVIRNMVVTHLAHHRAQLGVYLRLLGVPIPGSYGPSADEPI